MEKSELARKMGVAESDIVRSEEVDGKHYVSLNTGVIKCLDEDGSGWKVVDRIPNSKSDGDKSKDGDKQDEGTDEQKQRRQEEQERQGQQGDKNVSYANEDPNAATTDAGRKQANQAQNAQVLGETELDQTKTKDGRTGSRRTK